MTAHRLLVLLFLLTGSSEVLLAAGKANPGTVQLKTAKETVEGRVVVRDDFSVWLYDRSGRLRTVKLSEVKSFKQLSNQFDSLTPMALSTELIRELGKDYETATTRHYVVVAQKGKAKMYVELFDSIYRNFQMYFSVRGFDLQELEFPLVAIVFPTRQAFLDYAKKEGTDASRFGGYYSPRSNRAVLFEEDNGRRAELRSSDYLLNGTHFSDHTGLDSLLPSNPESRILPNFGAPRQFKSIDADQRDTMIHECTHQVAFNVGMHDRIGQNSKWIVEGLATVFEAPGIRNRSEGIQIGGRINQERLTAFKDYMKARRPKNSLESTLASDELFTQEMTDFYAEAWALSFFLVETRPRKYSDLLRRTATRDGSKELTRQERLDTFKDTIGSNLKLLDAEFIRFYEKLK